MHEEVLSPASILFDSRPINGYINSNQGSDGHRTYAIGLALAHRFDVGSPKAMILLPGPSASITLGLALISSKARLKTLVLLSEAKTSV